MTHLDLFCFAAVFAAMIMAVAYIATNAGVFPAGSVVLLAVVHVIHPFFCTRYAYSMCHKKCFISEVLTVSLFTIADLHLSFSVKKPMDVFAGWENYLEILETNWREQITDDDTVVLPGDFSWGMNLLETREDFSFLNDLPGKKILLRGNHDYWWVSVSKNYAFVKENGFQNIDFLQNNYFLYEDTAICGSRGWFFDSADQYSEKVAAREAIRLDLSLSAADKAGIRDKIVFLHFPPLNKFHSCDDLIEVMHCHGVKFCYYGHLHGYAIGGAFNGEKDGIDYQLISGDFLRFFPLKIR